MTMLCAYRILVRVIIVQLHLILLLINVPLLVLINHTTTGTSLLQTIIHSLTG